jgi:asparagine synthase (glutamine-hydrolysing)
MCGISGIVNFNVTDTVDRRLVEQMASAQVHRGPDDHGYFVEGNVGLGHRRLSIIDLSGGGQPIFNEDESVVVVFNGEIYNYRELTPALVSKGHRFRTKSDTETIVHAYEEYGDDCMRDFRGMFAFAIWDRNKKRLLLVRDRMGIKPVYYYIGKDIFVFASEIKSLLQHPGVPREIDHQALDLYLALRYVPGPRTMFKNIFKLQPGHLMTVDQYGAQIRKYWDLEYQERRESEAALIEEFGHLLEESVRLRLIADVPLGLFLSGGLDSSAMLAEMSKITGGRRIKTFSVGYEANGASEKEIEEANEFSYARMAASQFGAEHHEFCLNSRDFRNAIPTMVSHLDEPMADPSCIPLYFISKLARNYITVVLSGEGADETLGGYGLYRRVLALEKMRCRLGPVAGLIPALTALPVGDQLRAYMRRSASRIEDHYRGVVKGLSVEARLALTGRDRFARSEVRLQEIFDPYFKRVERASPLNRMLYADAKVWLPEDLLLKADKMTMATALELRVPFLDHKLVEFTAGLPDSLKIRNQSGKWILRHHMGTALPSAILRRSKKGFPSPASAWFRHELRDFVRDTLLSHDGACRRFFNPQAVEAIVVSQEKGRFSGFQEVWSLLVFEFWHRQFIERFEPVCAREECPAQIS